jgi:hypothetical protein
VELKDLLEQADQQELEEHQEVVVLAVLLEEHLGLLDLVELKDPQEQVVQVEYLEPVDQVEHQTLLVLQVLPDHQVLAV